MDSGGSLQHNTLQRLDEPLMRANLMCFIELEHSGQLPPAPDGRHKFVWAFKTLLGLGERP